MKFKLCFCLIAGLIISGCYTKETVVRLPEAENLHFTESGRLFVSSGVGFFEMKKSEGSYSLEKLNEFDCGFAGITQISHYIYTLCYEIKFQDAKKYLYVLDLNDPNRHLSTIADISEYDLPNGLTSNGKDTLYIANTAYFGSGSIVKVDLSESLQVVDLIHSEWAAQDENVYHPNGIKWLNDGLWFTDLGNIKRIDLSGNATITMAQSFVSRLTVYDDLVPHCDGILAADFVGGQLVYIDSQGEIQYKTGIASFQGASSLLVGRPPLFQSNQIVATERGILLEESSNIGNKVSTATFDFNLNDCR
ncbi:hypothetical protein [Pleionea sediminis]|uniref:hypothetical protein n=1 Tax=Pleionea sediminis TaxID=2569479 RepID=UPI001186FD66|nr:hypothetical protein [Pleionea sediminis]